ncbi:hypothetical protein PLICRDRAFT_180922 [Plicaturopsis crispa FD-325 SS-3]|uniref:Uncharacterized protein n=1 Tax=Plicaturopsis crispa FD-325 SS-3 TaxID=944288 RepID=A0A0C9SPR5_PLICR|nr:hypothetical protein PLICRDRAFT_180922 [Plicaturopsis crispa FD-325 SS-3]
MAENPEAFDEFRANEEDVLGRGTREHARSERTEQYDESVVNRAEKAARKQARAESAHNTVQTQPEPTLPLQQQFPPPTSGPNYGQYSGYGIANYAHGTYSNNNSTTPSPALQPHGTYQYTPAPLPAFANFSPQGTAMMPGAGGWPMNPPMQSMHQYYNSPPGYHNIYLIHFTPLLTADTECIH